MPLHFAASALKRPTLNLRLLLLLVFLFAMAGSALVARFADMQEKRDALIWQNKLNLIADSRQQAVQNWIDLHFNELGSVANDPSLQLYLTALGGVDAAQAAQEPQSVFLRNLLLVTADKLHLIAKKAPEMAQIKANLPAPEETGLALFAPDGKMIVGTAGLADPDPALVQKIAAASGKEPVLIDAFQSRQSGPLIGFVIPVYPIQADPAKTEPAAHLVAIKKLDDDLWKLLRQPGLDAAGIDIKLLRKQDTNAQVLSPDNGAAALASGNALTNELLADSFALLSTGQFAEKTNANGQTVLMTSRALARVPWVLAVEADKEKAEADSTRWLHQVQLSMAASVIAFLCALIAVWYYGTSRKSYLSALEASRLATHLAAQEKLLRFVADSQLESIVIVDPAGIVCFANEKAALRAGVMAADMNGKTLPALIGPARAAAYEEANNKVFETQTPLLRVWQDEATQPPRTIQSVHVPLNQIPIETKDAPTPGVLMIDQDITHAIGEKEKNLATQRQLISALLGMVDDRDPYAAHQSSAVAFVARAVAQELHLSDNLIETAEVAGKLMNIGKVMVPRDLLGRPGSLSGDEKKQIHESLQRAIAFLEGIAFDGPVVETLRQMQERMDGAGPLGLQADAILITARIIAVANAFIGMISPRAYRAAMDKEKALAALADGADAAFDRHVVVALTHYIENKKGQDEVMALLKK